MSQEGEVASTGSSEVPGMKPGLGDPELVSMCLAAFSMGCLSPINPLGLLTRRSGSIPHKPLRCWCLSPLGLRPQSPKAGWLMNSRALFLTVLGWKSEGRVSAQLQSGEGLSGVQISTWQKGWGALWGLFHKDTCLIPLALPWGLRR